MANEKRQFYCQNCSGVINMDKGEKKPKLCPFCGTDKDKDNSWCNIYKI